MQLFQNLQILALITGFALTSNLALADHRNHGNNARFKGGWNSSSGWARHNVGRNDFRGNRAHKFRGSSFQSNYRHRPSYYNSTRNSIRRDNWSVSFNIGSRYSNWHNPGFSTGFYSSYNYGSLRHDPQRYFPGRNRTRVVVNQPTVVYVHERPSTSRVISTSSRPQHSLLRDIDGNCFERTTDSRGNETRIQLSDYECDF